jgi:hypothetical protein
MRQDSPPPQSPDAIAIEALGYLAGEPELMMRFLALTGIEASGIRQAAGEPGFLAGVLQFFLAHEPTLMRFCESRRIAPAAVQEASRRLQGGAGHDG